MSEYRKNQFEYEEDFAISAECESCGEVFEDEYEDGECPECGGELVLETSHEGCTCEICGCSIDMWDDAYRHKENYILICTDCYDELDS